MRNLFLWFFTFSAPLSAAAIAHTVTRDELAKQLVFYQSIVELKAKFQETKTLKEMGMKLESDGELTVIRPSSVVWRVIHPSPLTVTLSESNVKIEAGDGKIESFPIEGSARESLKALVAWLKLDPDELIQSYRISQTAEGTYRFEPKAEAPVVAMEMTLKPGSYLERLRIEEKSGDSLLIRFEKPVLRKAKAESAHAK